MRSSQERNTDYQRQWRAAHPAAVRKHQAREKARLRAQRRLAAEYRERYGELVADEYARIGTR